MSISACTRFYFLSIAFSTRVRLGLSISATVLYLTGPEAVVPTLLGPPGVAPARLLEVILMASFESIF